MRLRLQPAIAFRHHSPAAADADVVLAARTGTEIEPAIEDPGARPPSGHALSGCRQSGGHGLRR